MTTTYTPTPGRAFIEPEQRFVDTGLIEIPKKYRAQKKAVARVTKWAPSIRIKCRCGHVQHVKGYCRQCQSRDGLMMVSNAPTAPFAVDITGMRVLYLETAVSEIEEGVFALPIDDIIAIIPDGFELDNAEDDSGIKRCKFCGPAKEGTMNGMIMTERDGKMVCPRCMKDENGVVFG